MMTKEEVKKRLEDKNIDVSMLAKAIGANEDVLTRQLDQNEIPDELLTKIENALGDKSSIFFGNNNEIASNNCTDQVVLKFLEILERKDKEIATLIDRVNLLTDKLIGK